MSLKEPENFPSNEGKLMNEEVQRIQVTLKQLETKVEKAQKWEALIANPLFVELITKDYLGDDAVRLTMNFKPKSDDNEIVSSLLTAKAMFSRFVANVIAEGEQAKLSIDENQALQDEIDGE